MKNLKYINESQFINDFSLALKRSLNSEYVIEHNKYFDVRELDIFIANLKTGHTYAIEVKGRPEQTFLPPEILPYLQEIKSKVDNPNNYFIVLSLSYVNDKIKLLFKESGIEVFEYEKHRDNLIGDFIFFMNSLDETIPKTSLIDDKKNLALCGMTTYAKWTFDLRLNSLIEQNEMNLFKLITTNALVDKENKHFLPFILNNRYKVSHHPDIIYEMPLQKYMASNHFINEKMKIAEGQIRYEFSEYGNQDLMALFLTQPFSTLFYFLVISNAIHAKLNKAINISIHVSFESNKRAILYPQYSLFQVGRLFETYQIPGNKADQTINLTEITKNSVFALFEKLYSLFISEYPQSLNPYVSIDRENFDLLANEFLK